MKDFFVSYHPSDRSWGEWVAAQLEEVGYSTIHEAWDFLAGRNLVLEIQRALQGAGRVLAVLSPDYLLGEFTQAQWAGAFAQDPAGDKGVLVPVMIKRCQPGGLLAQLVAIDLVGLDEEAARTRLIQAVRTRAGEVRSRPSFPGLRIAERPAFPTDLPSLLQRLPLPLAQLLRRALNSKSAHERHHNAYYLAEAALKLATALRVGLWLERCLLPGSELARLLEGLVLPTPTDWFDFLQAVDRALGERPDRALLPLGEQHGELTAPRSSWNAVALLAQAAGRAGVVSAETAALVERNSLAGFFTLVLAYRREVIEGGALRRADFYERFAGLWLEALQEVLPSPVLLGGFRLVAARLTLSAAPAEPSLVWQDLRGPASVPLGESLPAPRTVLKPGHLYFAGGGALVPLHPLAVYREDELGQEAVGFLHRTDRRTRREGQRSIEEIRRVDYLDYASGDNLEGIDAGEALAALLGCLRGQPAGAAEVQQAQERSASAHAALVEEIVAAGAALGDFELLGELGRGGMGIVYRARQRSMKRLVALKVLPPGHAAAREQVARFRREIAALGRCDHPSVVGIIASGVEQDRYHYAMEYVDGLDLGRLLRHLSPLRGDGVALDEGHLRAALVAETEEMLASGGTVEAVGGRSFAVCMAELFAEAALGLAHLHRQKILHRDLKPQNLMLTRDGRRLVILDLGLAKLGDASRDLSQSHAQQLGTLRYMAPEQLSGAIVDERTDIHALGATLYELLVGRALHDGDTETRLRQQILFEDPLSLAKLDRRVPRDLATIVSVATARDPRQRYASAQALAADLRAFVENRPIAAVPPGPLHILGLFVRRRPELAAMFAAVLLVLLGGLGGYWHWNRERVSYYANYVNRWEVPEGIGALSESQQQRRNIKPRKSSSAHP